MKIIDLSYTLSDKMLVFPGNPRPVYTWMKRANSEPYNATLLSMGVHTGTHVDSPLHFLMDGETVDNLPLDLFWGKARLFRAKEPPRSREISLKEVLDSGFSLGEAKIFVLETGISVLAETSDYNYQYAAPGHDLLDWLIESGITTFMTDITAVDLPSDSENSRHKKLFRHKIPIVENLKNLDQLPENHDFTICAMPLKLEGREGSPCRAAAWID